MNTESESLLGMSNYDLVSIYDKPSEFSEVICQIKKGTVLLIDEEESTKDFYSICTEAGIMGFCMKRFVDLKQAKTSTKVP